MRWIQMKLLFGLIISILFFITKAYAVNTGWGTNLTFPLITVDPPGLKGYRFSINYQPISAVWGHSTIYFDGSFGHWKLDSASDNHQVNIVAIAPFFRYYFAETKYISPYAEISIGLSYLSRTHLDDYNFGIHFAFQDQVALGTTFGADQHLFMSLGALHYSNASLSTHNRGMSIPLYLNVGYRF
jgi:hypothetical protein